MSDGWFMIDAEGQNIQGTYGTDAQGNIHVRREDPTAEETARLGLRQDTDVFDTWFSSALWPLSTLGWPDKDAADLRAFYPTDVLVTAPEESILKTVPLSFAPPLAVVP